MLLLPPELRCCVLSPEQKCLEFWSRVLQRGLPGLEQRLPVCEMCDEQLFLKWTKKASSMNAASHQHSARPNKHLAQCYGTKSRSSRTIIGTLLRPSCNTTL